jgi:uncharacterized protein YfaQ (DUF2300 family)
MHIATASSWRVAETSPAGNFRELFISPYGKNHKNARKPSPCEDKTTSTRRTSDVLASNQRIHIDVTIRATFH